MRTRLDRFLRPCFAFLPRSETRENATIMVKGWLSNLKRKTPSPSPIDSDKNNVPCRRISETQYRPSQVGSSSHPRPTRQTSRETVRKRRRHPGLRSERIRVVLLKYAAGTPPGSHDNTSDVTEMQTTARSAPSSLM